VPEAHDSFPVDVSPKRRHRCYQDEKLEAYWKPQNMELIRNKLLHQEFLLLWEPEMSKKLN
jgi:hypothetical protein